MNPVDSINIPFHHQSIFKEIVKDRSSKRIAPAPVDEVTLSNIKYRCALQRAENLAVLGVKNALELCVGESFTTIRRAYSRFGIELFGNDINSKFMSGDISHLMYLGDAITVATNSLKGRPFDCLIFSPPFKRKKVIDGKTTLPIDWIRPSYLDFLDISRSLPKMANRITFVLVLPGRSLSSRQDRMQFHKLLGHIKRPFEIAQIKDPFQKNKCKYVDIYMPAPPRQAQSALRIGRIKKPNFNPLGVGSNVTTIDL